MDFLGADDGPKNSQEEEPRAGIRETHVSLEWEGCGKEVCVECCVQGGTYPPADKVRFCRVR